VPSLFRDFSAPVRLKGQSSDRLAFLAARDSDMFNRWDALQTYATQVLLDAVAAHRTGEAFTLDGRLRDAIAAILQDAGREPAFAAEAIILPFEALLGDQMDVVDPDAIRAVREAARAALGTALRDEFAAAMTRFGNADPADHSGPAMAARALKNAALGYLTAAGDTGLAAAQFADAANMTDSLAALTCLLETADARREAALGAFYERWRGNPLVIDKWFAVQARAGAPDTVARVQALTKHADFDLRNPNRVRALISVFAGTQSKFHDKSGAGYALLADTVIALDAKNPQVAARLCNPLGSWRRYDEGRQALMRGALERILATENLSHNSYEMASKALA
jgi:aminopeptidase N